MDVLTRWSSLVKSIPPALLLAARRRASIEYRKLEAEVGASGAREAVVEALAELSPPGEDEAAALAPLVMTALLVKSGMGESTLEAGGALVAPEVAAPLCPWCGGETKSVDGKRRCDNAECEWAEWMTKAVESEGIPTVTRTCTMKEAEEDGRGHGQFVGTCGHTIRQCRCMVTVENPHRIYNVTDQECTECRNGVRWQGPQSLSVTAPEREHAESLLDEAARGDGPHRMYGIVGSGHNPEWLLLDFESPEKSRDFVRLLRKAWNPSDHPRGHEGNPGQFAEVPHTAPGWHDRAPEPATEPSFNLLETPEDSFAHGGRPPTTPGSRESLARSPVKSWEALDRTGQNEAKILVLADGTKGVFKPSSGETPMRSGVTGGTYYQREVAASDVAELLGFGDLVPQTAFRDLNGEPGSMQAFVEDADNAFVGNKEDGWTTNYDGDADAARAAAFDYLIGNMDRHAGNWLLKDGKIVLIDHGLSFPHAYYGSDYTDMQFFVRSLEAKLPLPDLTSLADKWPEVQDALMAAGLEDEAIALTRHRFDAVTSGKYKRIVDLPDPLDQTGKGKVGPMVLARDRHFAYMRDPTYEEVAQHQNAGVETGPEPGSIINDRQLKQTACE